MAATVFLLFFRVPGLCAVVAYFGVLFLPFAFPTETTLELLGVQKSVRLARTFGMLFIVGGAALFYFI